MEKTTTESCACYRVDRKAAENDDEKDFRGHSETLISRLFYGVVEGVPLICGEGDPEGEGEADGDDDGL
jgi:hypothetical protein